MHAYKFEKLYKKLNVKYNQKGLEAELHYSI